MLFGRSGCNPLKQQTGSKPIWGIVKPDDSSYIPAAAMVIPGTGFMLCKQLSGEIFHGKDQACVGKPAEPCGFFGYQAADRGKKSGTAIDGEHPERGIGA